VPHEYQLPRAGRRREWALEVHSHASIITDVSRIS
jgi:hypothetical protein